MKWKKIINEKSQVEKVKKKINEISDILINYKDKENKVGLLSGKTGIAIFFYYYSQFTNNKKFSQHAYNLLLEVFEDINSGYSRHTFCDGISGIGWTLYHLFKNKFLPDDPGEIFTELDDYLYKTMMKDIESGNYDYLHGAIGNGLYFLERLENKNKILYLENFLTELEKNAEIEDDGAIKWRSVIDIEKGAEGYNLSLSHGLASIFFFLGLLYENSIQKNNVLKLISGATKYLLKHKQDTAQYISKFPSAIYDNAKSGNSRIAWCYGDLGIGLSLLQVANLIDDKALQKEALKVLIHSTTRTNLTQNSVLDAGICHGSSGNALIYNFLYQFTGKQEFKNSANYWLQETLKMSKYQDGFAGFKTWMSEEYGGWQNDGSLLTGIAGIGLTLMAFVSDSEPNWTNSLLIGCD